MNQMTCGIDWAENHHDVALVDEDGTLIAKKRITADMGGFRELLELIAEHGGGPASTPVAIELIRSRCAPIRFSSWRISSMSSSFVSGLANGLP